MKTIVCYGDSNTYGYVPLKGGRYDKNTRWTCLLQKKLGEEYEVISEGCNGRTTVFDEPGAKYKNGKRYLRACLNSHKPVDLVILMLGSNDTKDYYHASAKDIAAGAEKLVSIIESFTMEKQGFVPKIILIAPPALGKGITSSPFKEDMGEKARKKTLKFPKLYKKIAKKHNSIFLNCQKIIEAPEEDCLHLNADDHKVMAEALYKLVKENI